MALGRYTGPTARLIAERLTDGRPKFSGGWYRVRGVCHKGDPRPDGGSLSIRDGKDRLIVHCFKDCDRRTVIEALESTTGWTIWNAWESGERRAGGGRSGGLNGAIPEVKQRSGSVAPSPDGPEFRAGLRWRFIESGGPASVRLLVRIMSNRQSAQTLDGVRQDKDRYGTPGEAVDGGTQSLLAKNPCPGGRPLG